MQAMGLPINKLVSRLQVSNWAKPSVPLSPFAFGEDAEGAIIAVGMVPRGAVSMGASWNHVPRFPASDSSKVGLQTAWGAVSWLAAIPKRRLWYFSL